MWPSAAADSSISRKNIRAALFSRRLHRGAVAVEKGAAGIRHREITKPVWVGVRPHVICRQRGNIDVGQTNRGGGIVRRDEVREADTGGNGSHVVPVMSVGVRAGHLIAGQGEINQNV